ncbi:MAG: protein translocase subunit SecD, partial [Quisquiliibacterium sp.]
MNRYPIWKYAVIAVTLVLGLLYTLPNFFGESPAVQVSSGKATLKLDGQMLSRVDGLLSQAGIGTRGGFFDGNSVKFRFADTDTQLKARDAIDKALNTDPADPVYIVALNLLSASPDWLTSLRALPMYLGLDLRGGVHFLLQVDMKQALTKRLDNAATDVRSLMREKNVRHSGISRSGSSMELSFRDLAMRTKAANAIADAMPGMIANEAGTESAPKLIVALRPQTEREVLDTALKQNITTLHNRVNELGVAEPVIQQQGADRIVVQLPGVQDTAKAKDILGRTATLEARLVDGSLEAQNALLGSGPVPFGSELFKVGRGAPVVLRKQMIFSGEQLTGAQATFDENQRPAVGIQLNDAAGRVLR